MARIIITILSVAFIISVALNTYFLMGNGINVDRSNHQHQYQNQFQGQLSINQFYVHGNKIKWNTIDCLTNEVIEKLENLHPISSFYAKVIYFNHSKVSIVYPEILQEKK